MPRRITSGQLQAICKATGIEGYLSVGGPEVTGAMLQKRFKRRLEAMPIPRTFFQSSNVYVPNDVFQNFMRTFRLNWYDVNAILGAPDEPDDP